MIGYKIINAIDIGASNIVAVSANVDRSGRILSLDIAESKSQGIEKGLVTDLEKLTNSIQRTIRKLQSKSKTKIYDAYININGNYITTRHSCAAIPLAEKANKVITASDIRKVESQARLLGVKLEEEVIHEFPQSYTVDGYNKVKNPLGLHGRKLEVDLYLLVAKISQVENLIKSVNQSGLEVADVELSGLAGSLAVLSKKERQEGCILVDIGAGATEVLIFKDSILRELEVLPFGGDEITDVIASKLRLSFVLAQDLKKSYGSVNSKDVPDSKEVLIKQNYSYKPIKQKMICELIETKIDRLLALLQTKLDSSLYRERINSGIIIVGGTTLLSGLLEKIELELKLPVRAGRIKRINLPSSKMSLYATAIGLIHYGINASLKRNSRLFSNQNLLFRFFSKVKEVYREYF